MKEVLRCIIKLITVAGWTYGTVLYYLTAFLS